METQRFCPTVQFSTLEMGSFGELLFDCGSVIVNLELFVFSFDTKLQHRVVKAKMASPPSLSFVIAIWEVNLAAASF